MKKINLHIILLLLATLTALGTFTPKNAIAVDDAIIAVVNDEVITLRDLQDYIRTAYVGLVAEGHSEERIKQIMLDLEINGINNLVEDKLLLSRANKLGLEVRSKLIDERVAEVKKRYASEEEFMQALISHGATLTELRNKITNQLKIKYVIDEEVRAKIYINPQDVNKYYQNNMNKFKQEEAIVLDSIFIASAPGKEAAKQKIQEALDLINSGKKFEDVAKEYSSSAPIGRVQRGKFVKEIEEKIFNLSINESSPIIEVPNGYYIFKVTEKIPSQIASLEEAKAQITNILFNQKFRERYAKWLADLKKDAYIEIKK